MTEWIVASDHPRVTQAGYSSRQSAQRAADRANALEREGREPWPHWHVEYEGESISADPAKGEEQVNALARQEVPRPVSVETLLADIEAALNVTPQPAQGGGIPPRRFGEGAPGG